MSCRVPKNYHPSRVKSRYAAKLKANKPDAKAIAKIAAMNTLTGYQKQKLYKELWQAQPYQLTQPSSVEGGHKPLVHKYLRRYCPARVDVTLYVVMGYNYFLFIWELLENDLDK